MRTNTLVTSYIQAVLFLGLGLRSIHSWSKLRDKPSAHLAFATALFGLNSLVSAINSTAFDQTPRGRVRRTGISFLVFGLRVAGLARFRMLLIGCGFTLLFVVIGLLPLLIFGNPSAKTVQNLLNVVRYVALVSAPMLLVGFAPPKALARRIAHEGAASA